MSKLEKVQNITQTGKGKAVDLNGEMSMDAELLASSSPNNLQSIWKRRQNSTKIRTSNLRKAEKTEFRDSRPQKNYMRGGGCAYKKNKTSQTQTNTKSRPPQKSAS